MTDTRPEPDLLAICDECLQPIADGEGYVWVDPQIANESVLAQPAASSGSRDLHEWLAAGPADAPWHTAHTTCVEMPAWAYSIDVARIRTWPGYLHWCVHLMGKNWLAGTDWEDFAMRSLEPQLAAVSGLRPIKPQSVQFGGVGD